MEKREKKNVYRKTCAVSVDEQVCVCVCVRMGYFDCVEKLSSCPIGALILSICLIRFWNASSIVTCETRST